MADGNAFQTCYGRVLGVCLLESSRAHSHSGDVLDPLTPEERHWVGMFGALVRDDASYTVHVVPVLEFIQLPVPQRAVYDHRVKQNNWGGHSDAGT